MGVPGGREGCLVTGLTFLPCILPRFSIYWLHNAADNPGHYGLHFLAPSHSVHPGQLPQGSSVDVSPSQPHPSTPGSLLLLAAVVLSKFWIWWPCSAKPSSLSLVSKDTASPHRVPALLCLVTQMLDLESQHSVSDFQGPAIHSMWTMLLLLHPMLEQQ